MNIGSPKQEKEHSFHNLMAFLEKCNNAVMLYYMIEFINTLIDAPLDKMRRAAIRQQFLNIDIEACLKKIQIKIDANQYLIDDTTRIKQLTLLTELSKEEQQKKLQLLPKAQGKRIMTSTQVSLVSS